MSVAISNNYAIVGAHYDNDNGAVSGSAYIFQRDSNGNWSGNETQKLLASDGSISGGFGGSVAISGSYIIIGAYGDGEIKQHLPKPDVLDLELLIFLKEAQISLG